MLDTVRPGDVRSTPAVSWWRPGVRRSGVACLGAGAVLFGVAALYPWLTRTAVHASWGGSAPLSAAWDLRFGPGTALALALGAAVASAGPSLAVRLPWKALLLVSWATTWAWSVSLALIDGRSGIAAVFARPSEYAYDAARVSSVHQMLTGFVARIPIGAPDHWQIHVSGHPPGALLVFVGLERLGIHNPFWLGLLVLTAGTTATLAGLVTVRSLVGERWGRRVAPFWAAAPAAIWVAVSADALFAAAAAWGLATLALAATGSRGRVGYAVLAGVLLGSCAYLSYGLVLLGVLAAAVLVAARTAAPLPWVLGGVLAVVAAFTAGGFSWWEAYPVLRERYYAGLGQVRPYSYWVWGNLAAATAATGLAVWAALPDTVRVLARRPSQTLPGAGLGARGVALLGAAAVVTMLVATASGMSKSEVERIWLPFSWWALVLPALLPSGARRWLLALQVATGVVLGSVLRTGW